MEDDNKINNLTSDVNKLNSFKFRLVQPPKKYPHILINNLKNANISSIDKFQTDKKNSLNPKSKSLIFQSKDSSKYKTKYVINKTKPVFEKILNHIQKIKLRTTITVDKMKKNLKITAAEIDKRKRYQKTMKGFTKFKFADDEDGKIKKNYKSFGLMNISDSNTFSNLSSCYSHLSTKNMNGEKETYKLNKINNFKKLASHINVFNGFKTTTARKFKNNSTVNLNFDLNLNLYDINEENNNDNLSSRISNSTFNKNNNSKKIFHERNFNFSIESIRKKVTKIYGIPASIIEQNAFKEGKEFIYLTIDNKIKLILELRK